ncbi:MAG: ComEC/Rec2 family competence protein, partial [Caulobacteraceae bacterium]
LKPGMRLYATQLWAQRRGLVLPPDPEGAMRDHFDCNRIACAPTDRLRPAIAAWWTKRRVSAARLADLCEGADILILRADAATPSECDGATVLRRADFAHLGSAEIFAAPHGWRFAWSQPIRGERPWSVSDSGG